MSIFFFIKARNGAASVVTSPILLYVVALYCYGFEKYFLEKIEKMFSRSHIILCPPLFDDALLDALVSKIIIIFLFRTNVAHVSEH